MLTRTKNTTQQESQLKVKFSGISCILALLALNSCSATKPSSRFAPINIQAYTTNPSLLSNMELISKNCSEKYTELQHLKQNRQNRINLTASIFSGVATGLSASTVIYTTWERDNADSRITALLAAGAGATTVPSFFYFGSDKEVQEYIKRIDEIAAIRNSIIIEIRKLSDLGAKLQIQKK